MFLVHKNRIVDEERSIRGIVIQFLIAHILSKNWLANLAIDGDCSHWHGFNVLSSYSFV